MHQELGFAPTWRIRSRPIINPPDEKDARAAGAQ
jgi:hypothetical protein